MNVARSTAALALLRQHNMMTNVLRRLLLQAAAAMQAKHPEQRKNLAGARLAWCEALHA